MSKLNLTKEQIKEIDEIVDLGFRCFYNPETGEITEMPDFIENPDADDENWEEVKEYVESNWGLLIEFDKMTSGQGFEVVDEFTETLEDKKLQKMLINALNRKKPFSNFKFVIDNSGEYRQRWFDFEEEKYCEWVEEQAK